MRTLVSVLFLFLVSSTSVFAEDIRLCSSLGDEGIETLQWSLGIIDQKLPKVPPAEAKALDELEARFNSQGLDGVVSPDIKRDLRAAEERGYYYLRIARMRLREAQVGAAYILVSAESAAKYSADEQLPGLLSPMARRDPSGDIREWQLRGTHSRLPICQNPILLVIRPRVTYA
jgi:hypothetical protein